MPCTIENRFIHHSLGEGGLPLLSLNLNNGGKENESYLEAAPDLHHPVPGLLGHSYRNSRLSPIPVVVDPSRSTDHSLREAKRALGCNPTSMRPAPAP